MNGRTTNVPQVVDIQHLGSHTPSPSRFFVDELLPADVVTLLAAHGGTGKTRLSIQLAVCLAMGYPFMGKKTERAKVLFYLAEDDTAQLQRVVHETCKKFGVAPEDLAKWLTVVDASDADSILFVERFDDGVRGGMCTHAFDQLQARIESKTAQVVIVDNASDVYGCDENNRPLVRQFIRALKSLIAPVHGAVLLLSHVDKLTARIRSSESYSGSTAWHNSVRSRLSLSATGQGLELEQQKSNRGIKAERIYLEWDGAVLVQSGLTAGSSDTAAMARSLHLAAILDLIDEFASHGESISTSQTARTNAFKMLRSEPDFPKGIRQPGDLWNLLRDAERDGRLQRESYRSAQRKEQERWRVVRPAPSAHSAPSSHEGATPQ